MLKHNILATNQCYANYKHTKKVLQLYKKACFVIFKKISFLINSGNLLEELNGPSKEMGFNRLTK